MLSQKGTEFQPSRNSVGASFEDQIDQVGLLDDSSVVDVALVEHLEEVLGMHFHKFFARVVDRRQNWNLGGRGWGGFGVRIL